jgi:orotidine-5'-phosphate decarboxylase
LVKVGDQMEKGLIFALDAESLNQALDWAEKLRRYVSGFKIGAQFFTRVGLQAVKLIQDAQSRVFLDMKFHDIPFTVEEAAYEAARMNVWMFNVHCSGGLEMMKRAVRGAERGAKEIGQPKPKVLGVTVLTSLSDEELEQIGFRDKAESQTLRLARLALSAGLDGIVASPKEIPLLRRELGQNFLIVSPGIRWEPASNEDQKRVSGPKEAVLAGANYLVVGRPIRDAKDPVATAKLIQEEILNAENK